MLAALVLIQMRVVHALQVADPVLQTSSAKNEPGPKLSLLTRGRREAAGGKGKAKTSNAAKISIKSPPEEVSKEELQLPSTSGRVGARATSLLSRRTPTNTGSLQVPPSRHKNPITSKNFLQVGRRAKFLGQQPAPVPAVTPTGVPAVTPDIAASVATAPATPAAAGAAPPATGTRESSKHQGAGAVAAGCCGGKSSDRTFAAGVSRATPGNTDTPATTPNIPAAAPAASPEDSGEKIPPSNIRLIPDEKKKPSIADVERPDRCKTAPPLKDEIVDGVKGVFMIIADWGHTDGFLGNGDHKCQLAVAAEAKKWLDRKKMGHLLRFVISAGDNIYRGLDDAEGRSFQKYWIERYDGSLTCVPWYAVLGNHDHGDPRAGKKCFPIPTRDNCSQLHGDREEVRKTRACVKGRKGEKGKVDAIPDCWAMPHHSYVVTAWEEMLDLTIVATDGNYRYWNGYPFRFHPYKGHRHLMKPATNESVELLKKQVARTDLPKNLLIFSHYPWKGKRGEMSKVFEPVVSDLGKSGKTSVYYFAGHEHRTDKIKPAPDKRPVKHYVAGAAGGICDLVLRKNQC